MKVAYLINQYPKVSHTFVRREIAALQADGIQILRYSIRRFPEPLVDSLDQAEARQTHVLLACPKWRMLGTVAAAALIRPIRFLRALRTTLRMARRSNRGLIRHLAYLTEACLLRHQLALQEINHVHAHFGTNSATVALLTHELGSVSYSFTTHGPEEFDQAVQWSLGEKIEKAAFVIGVSHFGRSQLCRQCDYQFWDKIHVVRCGVDGDYLDTAATPVPHTRKLVSIGRLSEQKGQLLLIEALGRLCQQNLRIELQLIGDGEFRSQIERAIAEHGLQDSVKIAGWADSNTIRCALDECCAFVLPSFAEGLPVVIMEAMARARPVLSTYIAGIPELVRPGKNGWLVPAGSVEDLANALRKVVTTPFETLTEMGQSGRAWVAEQYDSRRIGRQLSVLMRSTQSMQNRPKQNPDLSYE
jgi:colanic acid/amylovoran biosynthesis glycosyltransferase